MSGGKKKSSFQITSVTTDYEGPGSPVASDPPVPPAPTGPPPRLPNGEPNPDPGGRGTPRNGSPPPGAPASRFRVVKLPHGLGEPYRRGRWTCVDVYERDLEPPSFGRILEGIRGASGGTGGRSLDSRLELASLGLGAPIPQSGLSQSPTSWLRPPPTSPGPQARSFTGGLGQLAVPGKAKVETPLLSTSPPQQRPPEPGTGDGVGTSLAATPLPSLKVDVEAGGSTVGTPPLARRKDGPVRLRMELVAPEETGQVPPLDSRPNSPALYFDASLVHKSPDPFGTAAAQSLSLARSMLAISGHLDSDDDSGSGSLVGIDNKIEQAMVREDILVPSGPSVHLHSPLLGNTKLHSSTCSLSPWPPSLSLSPAPVPYPCILPPCPFLLWMQRNLSQLPQGTGQRMWVGLGWPGNPDTLPVPGSLGLGEVPPHVCGPGGGRGAKGADPGPGGAERCIRAGEWTAACTGQPRAAGPAAFLGAPSAWAPCT
uniref:TSC22 domain family protein 4 n=1 Tax=Castor canadensis TaxID=51338 RepID=A0A8C0X085_CASCN